MMLIFALRFLVIGKLATKRLNKDNPKVSLYVCMCVCACAYAWTRT